MARGRGGSSDRRGSSDGRGRWSSADDMLVQLRRRSERTLGDRGRRVKASAILALQAGLAAGLSWFVANDLLRSADPIFAPIAAVITLEVSAGQRYRRAVELVLGVAVGVAVGDTLIYLIGTGPWQVGLTVALATILSVFVGGSAAVVAQATSTAVIIAALVPPTTAGIYISRVLDALIGGAIALLVMALLLPTNPLTIVSRKAHPAVGVIADGLSDAARALSSRDAALADAALTRLNKGEGALADFRATLPEGRETVTIAPLRWRARGALLQYVETAEHLERVLGNAQVLVRRSVALINDQEPVPEQLSKAVSTLAEAVRQLCQELGRGAALHRTSDLAVQAVREAAEAYRAGLGFSGSVVVAQIRAIATDLLGAAGMSHTEANEAVRRAGGRLGMP